MKEMCDALRKGSKMMADHRVTSRYHRLAAGLSAVAIFSACGGDAGREDDTQAAAEGDASHAVHWGYAADDGPERWASLSPAFALCDAGREQSPIDLEVGAPAESRSSALTSEMATLTSSDLVSEVELVNNGHTIQVNHDEGSTLTLDDTSYELLQFHLHAPSEHRVGGRAHPMEMHLVHQSADGSLAVLGVLIDEGSHNTAFDAVWAMLPGEPGDSRQLVDAGLDIDDLLPMRGRSYRYEGSLTTPPCTEGVHWLVLATPIQLSADQIETFTSIFDGNNRPVQALNGRAVPTVQGPGRIDEGPAR